MLAINNGNYRFSYQSLVPAGAGTPRYENETWSLEVFGCGWCHPSPLDSRFRRPLNYSELAICERSLGFEFGM